MAVQYCEHCHEYIDLDYNCEHFDDNGNCLIEEEMSLKDRYLTREDSVKLIVKACDIYGDYDMPIHSCVEKYLIEVEKIDEDLAFDFSHEITSYCTRANLL